MVATRSLLLRLTPEAHGKLVERAIRLGLSPTAYARLVLLRHVGGGVDSAGRSLGAITSRPVDVLMLDEAVPQ